MARISCMGLVLIELIQDCHVTKFARFGQSKM
jgi:hypothetical protein